MRRPLPGRFQSQGASNRPSPATILVCLIIGCSVGFLAKLTLRPASSPTPASVRADPAAVKCPPYPVKQVFNTDAHLSAPATDQLGSMVDLSTANVLTKLRFKFSKLPRMADIPPNSNVFLTFSNGHYSTLMLNAAALVADLGCPIVVLAFDDLTAETCEHYRLPYIWSDVRMDDMDFRQDRCTESCVMEESRTCPALAVQYGSAENCLACSK
jgi:hypothetical protein